MNILENCQNFQEIWVYPKNYMMENIYLRNIFQDKNIIKNDKQMEHTQTVFYLVFPVSSQFFFDNIP